MVMQHVSKPARWWAAPVVLTLAAGFLTATATFAEPARGATAAARSEAPAKPRPLPPEGRANFNLPSGVEAEIVPPSVPAAGRPVSAGTARTQDRQEGVARLAAAAVEGPEASTDQLLLRGGLLLGATSLTVYLSDDVVGDPNWVSVYATVIDDETEVEQSTAVILKGDLPQCGLPLRYCLTLASTEGWNLVDGRTYRATVTAQRAVGPPVVSGLSNRAQAREVVVPPTVPAGQAAGCACPNVLTRNPGVQALRGNLVNTATGAMVRTESDLAMNSYGLPFEAARVYSSSNPSPGMFGLGWSWTYDARVVSAEGPDVRFQAEDGSQVVFQANGQGGFTSPPGVQSTLVRDGTGWLLRTADQRRLSFNADGRLVSTLNARGHGVRLTYSAGRLTRLTDAAGRNVAVDTNSAGRITKLTLPDLRSVAYGYTGDRLTSVRDARLNTWRYVYDAVGRLSTVTDPLNRTVVTSAYAANNRVTSQTDALGAVTRFTWDAATQKATTVDADGVVSTDTYRGNVLLESTVGEDTVINRYDGRLNKNVSVDEERNQSSADFDEDGDVVRARSADPYGYTEVNTYDTRNNLTQHRDRRGQVWTYTYNEQNEMTGQSDPEQGADGYKYTYDSRGLVTSRSITWGAGDQRRTSTTRYEYDSAGNRIAEVTATGRRTEFQYDATGRRTGVTDPRGTGADKLITGPLHTTRITYDAEDRPVRVYEPGNLLPSEYVFDAAGQLIATVDPLLRTSRTEYDRNGRVSAVFDAIGSASRNSYTAAGRTSAVTDALGNRVSWTYDTKGQVSTETTPRGNALRDGGGDADEVARFVSTFRYDHRGNRLSATRPVAGGTAQVTTAFDALGRPTLQTDELNRPTTMKYDENGNVVQMTDEDGNVLGYEYDGANRRKNALDNGAASIDYDELGNVTSQTSPTGGKVTWRYDADGRPIAITEPRGNVAGADRDAFTTTYGYDSAGNLTSVRDPLGNTARTEYDAQDRVEKSTDATGAVTRYAYDDADQVFAVAGPVKGAVADTLSQLFLAKVKLVAGKGPVNGTKLTLTGLDSPVTFAIGQITGVPMTRYGYDLNGNNVVTSDQLGRVRRVLYDRLDRPSASADPLGRARAYGYDADSNLTTMQTASNIPGLALTTADRERRTVVNNFDNLGRMTRRQLGADGPAYTYGYNGRNELINANSPSGASTYAYDDTGLLTRAEHNGRVFSYGYDENDNVERRTYPDGTVVAANFDVGNRMQDLTTTRNGSSQTFRFGYDVSDRLTTTTYPASTGGQETRSYDRAGRLSGVASATGAGLEARFDVTRDEVGNPLRIDTTRRDGAASPRVQETSSYAYDASRRLTAACYGSTTCGNALLDRSAERYDYEYDLVGNRTKQTHAVGADLTKRSVTAYTYDLSDQLLAATTVGVGAGVKAYAYDGEGNQTRSGAERFTYNLDHTLASASTGLQTATFAYDEFGNRVSGSLGAGNVRTWDWDINNQMATLAGESNAGLGSRSYAYGSDGAALAFYTAGGAAGHAYLHDWLGGTAAVAAANGTGEWAYDYDPFGGARGVGAASAGRKLATAAPDNPLQFAGGYNDGEAGGQAGNYHLRARDYDTETGRFTGTDPLGGGVGSAGMTAYSYAASNPVGFVDPTGMAEQDAYGPPPGVRDTDGDGIADAQDTHDDSLTEGEEKQIAELEGQKEGARSILTEAEGFTKQIGDEIVGLIMDLVGINDARACISDGDVGACISTALNSVPWGKLFKAAKVLIKAVGLGKRMIEGYKRLKAVRAAYDNVVTNADKVITAIRNKATDRWADLQALKKAKAQARAERQAAKRNLAKTRSQKADVERVKKQPEVKDQRSPGCSFPQSFTGDTQVTMADGSMKPIARVKAGDRVLAGPGETAVTEGPRAETTATKAVSAKISHTGRKQLVDLTLKGARRPISATAQHPVYVAGRGWVEAADVRVGDSLVTATSGRAAVTSVTRRSEVVSVYNLAVAERHTYFVAAPGTGSSVLVHNSNPAKPCEGRGDPEKGGFANGISADEIGDINRSFGGSTEMLGSASSALANAARRDGFYNKAGSLIRDIAGGHLYDNGNKRTAQAVVELLMQRNNVMGGPDSAALRGIIGRVGRGELRDVGDIASALRGY